MQDDEDVIELRPARTDKEQVLDWLAAHWMDAGAWDVRVRSVTPLSPEALPFHEHILAPDGTADLRGAPPKGAAVAAMRPSGSASQYGPEAPGGERFVIARVVMGEFDDPVRDDLLALGEYAQEMGAWFWVVVPRWPDEEVVEWLRGDPYPARVVLAPIHDEGDSE